MQDFALLHDGSKSGWQATFLAFHVAARLGAPLQIYLKLAKRKEVLKERITQVEAGARAADVSIELLVVNDFSLTSIGRLLKAPDGLFLPQRFVPDGRAALQVIKNLSTPLWIVSRKLEILHMAALVNDSAKDVAMMAYSRAFARRLQEQLTVIIKENSRNLARQQKTPFLHLMHLPSLTKLNIIHALRNLNSDLLFIPASKAGLIHALPCNCVLYP